MKLLRSKKKEDPREDEELIAAFRDKQDKPAFEALLNRHLHTIYLDSLSYLKDQEEAKDACLQLCGTMADKLRKYNIEHFKPWLRTVVRNHCIQLLKEKQRLRTAPLDEKSASFFVEFPQFDNLEHEEDIYELLGDAIDELKPPQRDCIVLFYYKGKSYEDISNTTGYPMNKVKSHIQNGRINLKKKLSPKHGEE